MGDRKALSFVVGILILGTLGFSQDAFAEPITLFPTFVDSFSVAVQDSSPEGLAFSSDGAKMFVVGRFGDDVNEYTLSTPFDVSTASFVDSFSVTEQDTTPGGLAFSSDGAKMFVVGRSGDAVYEYTLTTAFNVSTATFVDSFSVTVQDTSPQGLAFSSDGTKMFVVGGSGADVNEYTLTTAFNVSTATFVDSFSVTVQDGQPTGVAFSSDGAKMFVVGNGDADVNEYTLTTAFNVSTASFVNSFLVIEQDDIPQGLAFSSDGAKMFVVGRFGDAVNEYTLTAPFTLFPTFVDSFSVAVQDSNPFGLAFGSDGAKMFVLGFDGKAVYEYTLSTAFNVSTASFVDSFSVAVQETSPAGLAFSSDGTKMFVVGIDGDAVNEYTLSTAFNVTSASFEGSFSVTAQDSNPFGLAFGSDGAKMFVVGIDGNDINEYTLTTPFDVSTASFIGTFSVTAQDTFPQGLAFSSDGAKMFVVGNNGDDVNEYTLHTTLLPTFVASFSVSAQEVDPTGIAFSSDGTKMFVVGLSGDAVNEYIISIPICSPPPSGDWTITSSCSLENSFLSPSNVIVQNNSLLTIPSGVTLTIPSGSNITIEAILIKSTGSLKVGT